MDKYYIPKLEEFHIGFEYEELCKNFHYHKLMKPKEDVYEWINIKFDTSKSFSTISSKIKQDKIRVKYLDDNDIESLHFIKTIKNQWAGYNDYYSGDVSGEYGYYLYATIHFPRLYNKSNSVEDNLFKIILHRYFVTNENETTVIEDKFNEGESELVYKGKIKNKSELKVLLTQLNII